MAGLAFSKFRFPGRNGLLYAVVITMMIPGQVAVIPNYLLMSSFKWLNTYQVLIVPGLASAFGIFLMRQYLLTIPKEISEASFIDGCSEFQIFSRVILPLMKPIIGVVAIFTALFAWNDFLGPLIYITGNEALYPISIGLQFFRGQREVEYSLLMAASTLVVVPVTVIFLCFQRFFVEGITIGAVKG
jgi:multiple sugar transport system permease protein